MQEPAIGVEKPLKSDDNFLLDMGFLSGWKRIAEFLGVSALGTLHSFTVLANRRCWDIGVTLNLYWGRSTVLQFQQIGNLTG